MWTEVSPGGQAADTELKGLNLGGLHPKSTPAHGQWLRQGLYQL